MTHETPDLFRRIVRLKLSLLKTSTTKPCSDSITPDRVVAFQPSTPYSTETVAMTTGIKLVICHTTFVENIITKVPA